MNSFKKDKFCVIKSAISKDLALFCYNYFLMQRQVYETCAQHRYISPFETLIGYYAGKNEQVPHTYTHYSNIAFETLMLKLQPKMEQITGLKLSPNYTFSRLYKRGDILERHKDRFSCEISTTLNLGGDSWPIYLDPTGKEKQAGVKVNLDQGDMLIYMGCELEHWREAFEGKDCGQVFLHYNDAKKKTAKENLYDKRPFLGLPAYYKGFKIPKK